MRPALASVTRSSGKPLHLPLARARLRQPPVALPARTLATESVQHTPTSARPLPVIKAAQHAPLPARAPNRSPTPITVPQRTTGLPVVVADERRVSVNWSNAFSSRYHHIWLRDHCRCPSCFHPVTKQRTLDTFSIPPDVAPSSVQSTAAGLRVTWSNDGHVSLYPWSWLKEASYDPPTELQPTRQSPHRYRLWDRRIGKDRPTVLYENVMRDETAVLDWLRKIDIYGVCFVEGVPPTEEGTETLSRRIAHIRETQYGSLWSFTSDLAHGDTAYTTVALPAHTDTTYFTDPCGLQIFHLLEHTVGHGGESLLVDGFHVAQLVKQRNPRSFELLCRVPVPSHAGGDGEHLYVPAPEEGYPVLGRDRVTREVVQVRWNNNDRSVMRGVDPEFVEEWYTAIRDWNACLTDPSSELWVQLRPGTAVVINNHRVLHGRAAFTGRRRLCGAYVGMDDFRSRLRVLEEKRGKGERSVWDMAL